MFLICIIYNFTFAQIQIRYNYYSFIFKGKFRPSYSYIQQLGGVEIKFYKFDNGFLHQKVMLIDSTTATVGTANFDNRSFRLNFEITGVVADQAFAEEIEQMLKDDFSQAKEMTKSDVDDRSFWFKLGTRLARLTSPVQ